MGWRVEKGKKCKKLESINKVINSLFKKEGEWKQTKQKIVFSFTYNLIKEWTLEWYTRLPLLNASDCQWGTYIQI